MVTAQRPLATPADALTRAPAIGFGLAALALVALFWDALGNLWSRWGGQEELSHSYVIPAVSAWLIWSNKGAVRASVGPGSWVGVAIVAGGLSSLILGQLTSIYLFQHVGLVVVIAGLTAAFGGLSLLRTTAAPIAFLFFAVPPPFWAISVLSWNFQLMSSVLGVQMLEAMGVPVFLSGNIIDLGSYKLQVAEACSGLRYLFPFLSIGVIAAYMFRGPLWQKAIIVLATIPITILMNSFRIAATGGLVQAYGPEHAEGALHFFEGWVVFLFCLAALFGVVAVFCRLSTPPRNPLDALTTPELPVTPPRRATGDEDGAGPSPFGLFDRRDGIRLVGGLAAVAASFFVVSKIVTVDSLIEPERRDFAGVPSEFADWRTDVRPIDASVAEQLGADDSIVVDLTTPEGERYNLYMAYLAAQRDGRSWHSPRQCIPGGGWKIDAHDIVRAETGDGRAFNYNRMIIRNGQSRQLVYYWYDQRGRKVANEFVMKFWLIVDAVTRKRSDGAMVRLITPIPDASTVDAAEAKLDGLVERIEGFLPAYVPS